MKFFIGLIFLPTILAANKNLEIQHIINCPRVDDLSLSLHAEINNTVMVPNQIFFSAFLEVKEKIMGPIDVSYEINRCDLKSENCEKFTVIKKQGVCKALNVGSGLLVSNLLNEFKPPLKCPIMPGKYVIEHTSVDFTNIALLFVDGYIWIGTVKLTSSEGKNRKLAMCIQIDAKITKSREARRKN